MARRTKANAETDEPMPGGDPVEDELLIVESAEAVKVPGRKESRGTATPKIDMEPAPLVADDAGYENTESAENTDGVADSKYRRPQVLVDGEIFQIVEGDLPKDLDELEIYEEVQQALQAQYEAAHFVEQSGFGEAVINEIESVSSLIGIVQDGKLVRWAPGTVLSYCVLRQTFPQNDWYEEVAENMWLAATDWANTCGVEFQYVEAADESESLRPPEVLFPVRHISAGGAFIAAAFFPHDPVRRRRLLVDPSYHTTSFNRVGVLRHEIGHILGFRHEQVSTSAPKICPNEDPTGTLDLTAYDPQSVMHYFCGGVGSRDLAITDVDRTGSQRVYGPPLASFQLLEA